MQNTFIDNSKKLILLTGAGAIGSAIAKQLLEQGYKVHIVSKKDNVGLDAIVEELSKYGEITYSYIDLSKRLEVVDFAQKWEKNIYGIINNAGVCIVGSIDDPDENDETTFSNWDTVIDSYLSGHYFLTKGMIPFLSDGGRIVNIASQLGTEGRAGFGVYCASKFALIGLTKCWAKELGKRKITVNAVCPGWVNTEMARTDLRRMALENQKDPEVFYKEICAPLELKRFLEPCEIANLVIFLISPEGSSITGRDMLLATVWNQI